MENLKVTINEKINSLLTSDNTFEALYQIIHHQGERIFCEYTDEYEVIKISYQECDCLCKKTANFLSSELTEKSGAYIGIMMENSIEWIMSFWGLLMAGYKPMLLNEKLSQSINEYICEKLEIKTILTTETCKSNFKFDHYLFVDKHKIEKYSEIEFPNWKNEIALSTTATSLNVKICIYNGKNFKNQVLNARKILKQNKMIKKHYQEKLKLLTFLPFCHIFGLVAVYFWFSVFGRTFVFLKDYSPKTILNTVKMHKVTHIFAVPILWHTIYREINKQVSSMDETTKRKFESGLNLSIKLQSIFPNLGKKIANHLFKEVQDKVFGDSIQFMITGGGYIKKEALRFMNGIGYPLYNGYGMSEIGITSVELREKAKYRMLGSIGKPFETVKYKIEDGKLFVQGSSLCSKIISKNKTVELKEDEWFDTEDIARIDKNGSYYIEGRNDDIFIGENGEKINPDLIEIELDIPSAQNYAIIGLEQDHVTELSLVVEIGRDYTNVKTKKVIGEIRNSIDQLNRLNYNIGRVFITYDEISNANGIKVSRKLLLRRIEEKIVNLMTLSDFKEIENRPIDDLKNDICEEIKELMANILDIDVHTINDNSHFIFELGGTSLDYLTLLMEIKEKYEIDLNFENKSCTNAKEFSEAISKELNIAKMS